MFDVCSLANALALGLLIFVVLYSGRRARNRYQRRNHTGNVSAGDIDNGVPELLEWKFDKRDRDFIRVVLLATGISLFFCYLKHRKTDNRGEWDMLEDSESLLPTPALSPSAMSSFDYRYATNPDFKASVDNADPAFATFAKDMSAAWDKARRGE